MLLNHCHPHLKRGKHGGVFEAYYASADNDNFTWEIGKPGQPVGVQDVLAVNGNGRILRRARSTRDQDVIATNRSRRFDRVQYFQCVRLEKSRCALKFCDPISIELRSNKMG